MSEARVIPRAEDVPTPSGSRLTLRFANGKIVSGRAEIKPGTDARFPEGRPAENYREFDKIVGILRRVGLHEGVGKESNKPYGQIEADIETADGWVRLKADTTDTIGKFKVGSVTLSFMDALCDLEKDELVLFGARQGTKPNDYGNFYTYANGYHLSDDLIPTACERQERIEGGVSDRYNVLLATLKQTSAWADRPVSEEDAEGGSEAASGALVSLVNAIRIKGWPTFAEANDAWLDFLAKVFPDGGRKKSISEYSDGDYAYLEKKVVGAVKAPPVIQAAIDLKKAAAIDECDPFADE